MKLSDVLSAADTLLTPKNLQFYPLRVGAGKDVFVPSGTRVKYVIERTGDFSDELVLRLFLNKKVMGYKTYVWSATFTSRDEMRDEGFSVKG